MDSAFCTLDARTYTALAFSKLPPDTLEEKRRHLVCAGEGCGARAFYRSRGRDGHAPGFGSYEHAEGCGFAGTDVTEASGSAVEAELGSLRDLGNRLRLAPDRQLVPVLRSLVVSRAFRESDVEIDVPGFAPLPAHRFFVPITATANPMYVGRRRGYWGSLVSAHMRSPHDSLWLNVGAPREPSVLLPNSEIGIWFARHRICDTEDLAGAYFLALGVFTVSRAGKRLVRVTSGAEVAVVLP